MDYRHFQWEWRYPKIDSYTDSQINRDKLIPGGRYFNRHDYYWSWVLNANNQKTEM